MAEAPPTSQLTDSPRTINLKILSPATELANGLDLPDTPLTSTIAQLKTRIQDAIPSHPPLERLRVICHGRVSRDAETVEEVLARAPLQDESPRVLHVVISSPHPLHAAHIDQPRASSMPPDARARATRQQSPFRVPRNPPAYGQPSTAARQAQSQHPSRPTTPGPHAPQPMNMNPAEIFNNMLNQALHGQMPQGFPGFPMGPQRVPSNPPPGFPQLPPELTNPQDMRRAHQELRQEVLQDMNQRTNNPPQGAQPTNQLPRTAPVTRSTSPQPPTPGTQVPGATEGQNSAINPLANPMPHMGGQQPPLPPFQFPFNPGTQVFGAGQLPEGGRWTMTVQNTLVNGPIPNVATGMLANGQPNGPIGIGPFGVQVQPIPAAQVGQPQGGLLAFAVPGAQPIGLPQGIFPPGLTPRAVSPVRSPSGGQPSTTNIDERNRRIADSVVHLSHHLTNITRSIHILGAHLGHRRPQLDSSREPVAYISTIADIEALFRAFDQQTALIVSSLPEITSNAQFGQAQEARRTAAVALAQLYDVVRNQVMPPTLRTTIPPSYGQTQPQPPEAVPLNPVPVPAATSRPQIYILNDTRGNPCALLVGPSGNYVTPPLPWNVLQSLMNSPLQNQQLGQNFMQLTRNVYNQTMNDLRYRRPRHRTGGQNLPNGAPSRRSPNRQQDTPAGAGQAPPAAEAAEGAQEAGQRAQAREVDEMRDLLAPIVRNLWLLIRIGGFLYFMFGGGRALWRPFALICLAGLIYALQAGMFGDHFEPFRRYLDRIVGVQRQPQAAPGQPGAAALPNQQPGNAGEQPAENAPGNAPPGGIAAQVQLPTPEDIARRLVDRHNNENASWMERQLRYVERTIMLFIASLWPGIGEQAVRRQEENEQRVRDERREEARLAIERTRAALDADNAANAAAGDATATAVAGEPVLPAENADAEKSEGPAVVASGVDVGAAESGGATRVNKGKARQTDEAGEAASSVEG